MTDPLDRNPHDALGVTQGYSRDTTPDAERSEPPLPSRLGRYVVRGRLGRGGFADVLLAHDEQLDRQIALKLPRRDRFQNDVQMRAFVEEARTAARLQHPGIVTVFDVGSQAEMPFIVLEYIRGRSLSHLLEHEFLPPLAAAQLVAEVAEALAHAHEQGFVHRDIKPQNILLDTDDRPHIADFGLAVRHREQADVSEDLAGTTHYMSPEQVRGENHRIDGRTDIWALGVVFYRLLTGRLPFTGSTAQEVFQNILYTEPVAPHRIDATVPAELERICLRCMCQQMSGRYRSALDLADELNEWIRFTTGESGSSLRRRGTSIEPPDAAVVPRGLRSFTQEDRDFFLKLIPGPRDRDGLPTPVHFWKSRLEEREPDETFNVGLLYGPSGCGKSSLIKAGVLPRLKSDVNSLFVDATSRDTETRILRLLRRKFKGLSDAHELAESLCDLREQVGLRSGQKVLLILDQFEQWLQHWQAGADAELVRALRQCDGGNVQCVLLVRDDFWLPVSRLMRQLELGIVDGTNAMLVDSFDLEHARRVLRELGVAYKRLPGNLADQTGAQTAFIAQATAELAENNRLYPVRLAVFVEMVKDREWTPETLDEMGGTEGVGVAFLENSVGSRARPARRVHEQAARGVLAALLPQTGQIKDSVRTRSELLGVSKYTSRPGDFDDLMHLLDVELRLLTPARSVDEDTRGAAADSTSTQPAVSEPVYQLTHDFLVPSIREWLDCQLRATRRGRARLLLQEQAELWNNRPSNRTLPSLLEWMGLWIRTNHREWTRPQRRMMRAASRRLLRQTCVVLLVVLIGATAGTLVYQRTLRQRRVSEATVLFSKLRDVDISDVPRVVSEITDYREWVDPLLEQMMNDDSETDRNRIRAAMALLPTTARHTDWLAEQLISEQLPAPDFPVIRAALVGRSDGVAEFLRRKLAKDSLPARQRFRVACALAGFDDSAETWNGLAREVAASLLLEPAAYSTIWIKSLEPVAEHLRQPLISGMASAKTLESARIGALALYEFDAGQMEGLGDALVVARSPQYRAILEQLRLDPVRALRIVRERATEVKVESPTESDLELHAQQQANLIIASFELGDPTWLREASKLAADPRPRTYVIHAMHPDRIDLTTLVPLILDTNTDQPMQNVAMLAAWHHMHIPLSEELHRRLTARLQEIYRDAADSEAHSVAGLLLRKLGVELAEVERGLAGEPHDPVRNWYVNNVGQSMVVLRPNDFHIDGYTAPTELNYDFAISATEIPLDQFQESNPDHTQDDTYQRTDQNVPAAGVLIFRAAKHCNWLSQQDNIPPDQWCYPPDSKLTVTNCYPVDGFEDKAGYRLPLRVEWEFACRAGSTTSRFFGEDVRLMQFYGWHRKHSETLIQPVAELLPNPFGLFDIYGNVYEICIANQQARSYAMHGESCFGTADQMDSGTAVSAHPQGLTRWQGFRVVQRMKD